MSSSPTSSSSTEGLERGAVAAHPTIGFEMLHDVRCAVDFILGTGRLTVRDCLDLALDRILRLDQGAGSDLKVSVHGVPLARGEVVIVDENVALRVTRILSSDAEEEA